MSSRYLQELFYFFCYTLCTNGEPHLLSYQIKKTLTDKEIHKWVQDDVWYKDKCVWDSSVVKLKPWFKNSALPRPSPLLPTRGRTAAATTARQSLHFLLTLIFTIIIISSSSSNSCLLASRHRGKAVLAVFRCFLLLLYNQHLYFQVVAPETSDVCCITLWDCEEPEHPCCLVYWLVVFINLCLLSKEN